MKKKLLYSKSMILIAALFIPHILFANNSVPQVAQIPAESAITLPVVLVTAERISPTTGTFIINKEMIESLPRGNGSVNEIISIAPGVQFNEGSADSFTQGEILPPLVSVSGSRYYDNNYTIDGINNNSPLDPMSDSTVNSNRLPGYPQIHVLNPQIIDQITVYNSNIPAEFGGFTGGQIDTKTIDPEETFWGKITYRTTRSDWTNFHIDPKKKNEFENSETTSAQPEFEKHEFGVTLNTPLSTDTALVTSYQQLYSKIPLQHIEETNTQSRRRDNLFLKLTHYLPSGSKVSITALSSPSTSEYFRANFKDSDYKLENDNNSLSIQYENQIDLGELNFNIGYTDQQSNRQTSNERFFWKTTDSITWETGKEGGLGELEMGQKELSVQGAFGFHEFQLGQFNHKIKIGMEATHSRQSFDRHKTSYYYYSGVLDSSLVCSAGDVACIDGEQYLSRRVIYNQAHAVADVFDAAGYVQDTISWKRFELFPGLRFTYDDVTEEKNIAPRLSTSLDIFGNRQTILFAGLNRYYSGTLLTHTLYEPIKTFNQYRTTPGINESDWSSTTNSLYRDSSVKTPYTDEQTVGLIQQLLGGEFKIQYINKVSKDEFAKTRINNPYPEPDIYLRNNLGRSEHESLQVSWLRSWQTQQLEVNATWQKTNTSHTGYDDVLDDEDLLETVWYEGEELLFNEIPRRDFNRPFVINLIYSCRLPYDVMFTNTTKYRGAYWRLWNTVERKPSERYPDQSPDPYVYEKRKNKRTVTFDWHLSWKVPSLVQQHLVLTLDILNVFDKKAKIAYQTGTAGYDYEVGRQLWAGIELNF
jgi:hypothetical protein